MKSALMPVFLYALANLPTVEIVITRSMISQKIGDIPRKMERPQSKDGFGGAGKTARK
ncbi:hypothetical protein DAPPUDRAFT_274418 [Daphnia pulex]|uniref:Uncharacterized protein n=1 Tax=Daphnia pulex TaxID=6669 RepID=E9I472_DAPPU|nr:hypothetical protein DAPPUDRAFT_274418 [Daphnia pulex]|eukprot:EFX61208.1 hypothetical protein DAPPUDRAFT_274418 [Daphnia pulex]